MVQCEAAGVSHAVEVQLFFQVFCVTEPAASPKGASQTSRFTADARESFHKTIVYQEGSQPQTAYQFARSNMLGNGEITAAEPCSRKLNFVGSVGNSITEPVGKHTYLLAESSIPRNDNIIHSLDILNIYRQYCIRHRCKEGPYMLLRGQANLRILCVV